MTWYQTTVPPMSTCQSVKAPLADMRQYLRTLGRVSSGVFGTQSTSLTNCGALTNAPNRVPLTSSDKIFKTLCVSGVFSRM